MNQAIAYYRVSTDRQGQSGLGLEAQQKAVAEFACSRGLHLLETYTEVESSGKSKRPVLQTALSSCELKKAVLIIAKLDRLGRSVAFVSKLMESRVEFLAVDAPHANKLIVHIMAAFAEHERDQIRMRTKKALEIAKLRGTPLGRNGKEVLSKQNKEAADVFAIKMKPLIERLQQCGFTSIRKISHELNRRNIPPYRGEGHQWHRTTVQNLLQRIESNINTKNEKQS